MPGGIVTLLTDFGTEDGYVGAMKGVVLSYFPDASIVDISHYIPPFNLKAASLVLEAAFGYFPRDTVHVFVVDPGVGSTRRHLFVRTADHIFIGPDNGVLGRIAFLNKGVCYEIRAEHLDASSRSNTFHGRDVYAVAAGKLLSEGSLESVSRQIDDPEVLEISSPASTDSGFEGEIIYADHFGNLVTNLRTSHRKTGSEFKIADTTVPFVTHYSELTPRKPGALLNSWGYFEIAMYKASARDFFALGEGAKVKIVHKTRR